MCVLTDFIVVGSDSGRIVILEYLLAKNAFEKVLHFKIFTTFCCLRTFVSFPYDLSYRIILGSFSHLYLILSTD